MPISERDFQLLQEEVKCLRKKFASTVSTAGGYIDGSLTAPDSSVYPNSNIENCVCGGITDLPNPDEVCPHDADEGKVGVGSMGGDDSDTKLGIFAFDAEKGVFYKDADGVSWHNRNTGLADTKLEHGTVDPFWREKAAPNPDSCIVWQCGQGRVMRTDNAGKSSWKNMTPQIPETNISLSNVTFVQIVGDIYLKDSFYVLAYWRNPAGLLRCGMARTLDDGKTWTWFTSLDWNGSTEIYPLGLALGGGDGAQLWLTEWTNLGVITALRINNDPEMTLSDGYDLGTATLDDIGWRNYWASPTCPIDDDMVYFYGRMNNPAGLSDVVQILNFDGFSWNVIEDNWGDDWCGGLEVSMANDGGDRKLYSVRNVRL